MLSKLATLVALLGAARAQQACSLTTETHPSMSWSKCSSGGSCSAVSGSVTVDANWRWTHSVSGSTNCYTGNTWDATYCPDGVTCAKNCCLDGADYAGTYGATTSGNALSLQFVTQGPYSTNIGSRMYLMASDTQYQMFNLLGNEFTFDVDVSQISCGLNGALYFVSMDADGGMAKYSGNKAGAKYGTGYCDSQSPRDIKFINGAANSDNWVPSSTDKNAGLGEYGSACAEMDIWEANDISTALTPHPCLTSAQHECTENACGGTYSTDRYAGDCDPDGCDFNPYRQGNKTFYGPGSGFTLDTTQKMTVVTQFLTDSSGDLSEIKRFYVQNGKVIPNSQSTIAGVTGNSITDSYCTAQKTAFGDTNVFSQKGGLKQMGAAMKSGMVLVMSIWDDHSVNMLWLDSTYPTTSTSPGAQRGSCSTSSGAPSVIESSVPNSKVTFSNIKFGPIGSTFNQPGGSSSSVSSPSSTPVSPPPSSTKVSTTMVTSKTASAPATSSSAATGGCQQTKWGQCGGIGWTGCTVCASGSTCQVSNPWYSQCL